LTREHREGWDLMMVTCLCPSQASNPSVTSHPRCRDLRISNLDKKKSLGNHPLSRSSQLETLRNMQSLQAWSRQAVTSPTQMATLQTMRVTGIRAIVVEA